MQVQKVLIVCGEFEHSDRISLEEEANRRLKELGEGWEITHLCLDNGAMALAVRSTKPCCKTKKR